MEKRKIDLKLSAPAHRALANAGIKTFNHFTKFSEKEIAALHGLGPTALVSIKQALKEKGLSFSSAKK